MSTSNPFRCPKCDHVVKYHNEAESHCLGCGRALRLLDLKPVPPYDQQRQCYNCWLVGPDRCNYTIKHYKKSTATVYDQEVPWKITSETEQLECPGCGSSRVGKTKAIEKERDFEREKADQIAAQRQVQERAARQAELSREEWKREAEQHTKTIVKGIVIVFALSMIWALLSSISRKVGNHQQNSQGFTSSNPNSYSTATIYNSQRRLTDKDLSGKSAFELDIIRNEPYARHGFKFGSRRPDLIKHFSAESWYQPTTANQGALYKQFTESEKYNVQFVLKYQRKHGLVVKRPFKG